MTTTDTTPDLNTLSGRIAFERDQAGNRAMRHLYPDLPELYWVTLDSGLVATARECHVHNGTLAVWVERLGLVEDLTGYVRPGYSRYVGTVDGIPVEISGITDSAAWNAARANARVKAS